MSKTEIVLSQDLLDQITRLDGFDETLQRHMRPAMTLSLNLLLGAIGPMVPTLTGWARASLSKHNTGSGLNLTG
jgi:hypothetical protein